MSEQTAVASTTQDYGKLVFLDKEGVKAQEYPITKPVVVLGRDKTCDIVITRREVSRHHAQLAVDDAGSVWLSSLGREPVSVNGKPATQPVELFAGDHIEIFLEGRVKVICYEAENDTFNKLGCSARKPLAEADQNVGSEKLAVAGVKNADITAGIPQAPSSGPAQGSQGAGDGNAAAHCHGAALGAAPKAPPRPPPLPARSALAAAVKGLPVKVPAAAAPRGAGLVQAAGEEKPVRAAAGASLAPCTFLPSADELQALRAGLRKTGAAKLEDNSGGAEAAAPISIPQPVKATNAKKRKSVRFTIPPKEPHSPEGVPTDATVRLDDCGSPPSPDVIINVGADSTVAFAVWAMGADSCAGTGGDVTGGMLGCGVPPPLPSIREEPDLDASDGGCSSPEVVVPPRDPAGLVTPSREITPELRRRSGAAQASVGRKRRSCSGSRNGTPGAKQRSLSADPELLATRAEEAALDASIAAAEAAAAAGGAAQQPAAAGGPAPAPLSPADDVTAGAAVHPQAQESPVMDGTPPAAADLMDALPPGSPATPWVSHFSAEAAAVAAALASSRSATPASGCAEGGPGGAPTTPRRRALAASGRKSRLSLAALAAPLGSPAAGNPAGAGRAASVQSMEATEVLPGQLPAAGLRAPINTPTGFAGGAGCAQTLDPQRLAEQLTRIGGPPGAPPSGCRPNSSMTASLGLGAAEARNMTVDIPPAFFGATITPGRHAGGSSVGRAPNLARQHAGPGAALQSQQSVDSGAAVPVCAAARQQHDATDQTHMQDQESMQVAALAGQLAQAQALAARLQAENEQLRADLQQAQAAAAAWSSASPSAPEVQAAVHQDRLQQMDPAAQAACASQAAAAGDLTAQVGDCQAAQPATGPLPFEGLSQAMSQGSLEWLEGVIMPSGSSTQAEMDALVAAAAAHAAAPAASAQQPDQAQQPSQPEAGSSPASRSGPPAQLPFLEHVHGACPPCVFELPLSQPAAEAADTCGKPAQGLTPAGGSNVSRGTPPVTAPLANPEAMADAHTVEQDTAAVGMEAGKMPSAELAASAVLRGIAAAREGAKTGTPAAAQEAGAGKTAVPVAEGVVGAGAEAADAEEEEEDVCMVCGEADEGDMLLLCDGCNAACHLGCAAPRLRRVPKGDWFCAGCRGQAPGVRAHAAAARPTRSAAAPQLEEAAADRKGPEEAMAAEPEQAPARAARRSSEASRGAQEPAPPARRSRRASVAPAPAACEERAAEAPMSGRTTRRRASMAATTPAAAALAAGAASAVPETAASTRGGRRAAASPAPALALPPAAEAGAPHLFGAAQRTLSGLASVEASLGPPVGSLGVIKEADEEMGSDADEGQSAPAQPQPPTLGRATRGKQARQNAEKEAEPPHPKRTQARAAKRAAPDAPATRRTTRSCK